MRKLTVTVALALATAPFMVGTQAASGCAWDSGTATLTVTADGVASLAVSGQDFLLDGVVPRAPAGATTSTVDQINVIGTVADEVFTLDLGGGAFAPGATVEAQTSEIGPLQLGADVDQVVILGTSATDNFEFGVNGLNLNADDDVDVTFGDVEDISVLAEQGRTWSPPMAPPSSGGRLIPLHIEGGPGNDSMAGGDEPDVILGEAGTDEVAGGKLRHAQRRPGKTTDRRRWLRHGELRGRAAVRGAARFARTRGDPRCGP